MTDPKMGPAPSILDPGLHAGVNTQEWLKGAHVGVLAVCAVVIRRSHGTGPMATPRFPGRVRNVEFDEDLSEVRDRVMRRALAQGQSDSFVKGVEDGMAGLWEIAALT